jgi:hypothetical protein
VSAPAAPATTTVVVARLADPLAADVLEVVRDWTTTELLGRSVWLDVDQPADAPALAVVDPDGTRSYRAEEWLAVSAVARPRVVLLQVFADDAPAAPLAEQARALLDGIGLGSAAVVNLMVPATTATPVPEAAVLPSRPNVLLQARDGQAPGMVSRPVPAPELARHAASGLATVAALWTSMDEAPFDASPTWPGQQVVVARAYARTLDSREVLIGLSHEVYRAEGTLPHPRTPTGDRLTDVPDVQALATAEAAADDVLAQHSRLTRFEAPPPYQEAPRTGVGLWQAVRMFLSFLWTSLRSAPTAWLDALVRKTAAGIATWTNDRLFGSDSAYEVVVLGVRPSNRPAQAPGEDEVGALIDSAHRIASAVSPGTEFSTVDTGTLWNDVTTVAVGLADGSDVPAGVRMPMLGLDRQVVDRPEVIVPSPAEPAHRLPVGALPGIGALTVGSDDPYLAGLADSLLVRERDRPGPGGNDPARYTALDSALSSLRTWSERHRSFAWRLGHRLAYELNAARETLAAALSAPAGDAETTPPWQVLESQRKTRRFVLGALLAVVVALALVVGLVVAAVLSVLVGSLIGVVLVLLWLFGSTRVFLRHQRALFECLHGRDERRRRQAWAQSHAAAVAREVHRLGVLYRQSRLWNRVLAAVVHDPFGVSGTTAEDPAYPAGLSGSLPLSVAVGSATFSRDEHAQLVHEARRAQVRTGWLGAQLHARIETALTPRSQRYGRAEHRAVWSDTGYSEQGPLHELVTRLGTPQEREAAAAAADARLVTWLTRLGAQHGLEWSLSAVHPRVTVRAGAQPGTVSGSSFLSPVLGDAGHLDPLGFSATGAGLMANRVETSALAAVGVPVPRGTTGQLRVVPPAGQRSMDRFVARLDCTRSLSLDQIGHFTAEEPAGLSPVPAPSVGIDVEA